MDLQQVYYFLSILLMILGIIFLLGCIGFLILLYITLNKAKKFAAETSDKVITSVSNASGATGIGLFLVKAILKGIKHYVTKE